MNLRYLFFKHLAQTSLSPIGLEIIKAEGCELTAAGGEKYLDMVGGISVANIGHRNPKVVEAIKKQADEYLHIMVYGELVQSPQVEYAHLLTRHLPDSLNSVYFTNSGAEAVEGAMKLAKRVTGRTGIASFINSYHGSTQGALSLFGDEYWRNSFRPLLPGITHLHYNSIEDLSFITDDTACVVAETIQAEAGIIEPDNTWLTALRQRCNETGALLVLDEIQTGFGRTGQLWAFTQYLIEPDILLLGKALGGGMPLGAFIADQKLMEAFTENPVLGHITTFGGHPVCCASGMAAFTVLLDEELFSYARQKAEMFRNQLMHPRIKQIRSCGLWLAIEFDSFETNKMVIDRCIQNGLLTDWFLFAPQCLRISPPLIITEKELLQAAGIIMEAINNLFG